MTVVFGPEYICRGFVFGVIFLTSIVYPLPHRLHRKEIHLTCASTSKHGEGQIQASERSFTVPSVPRK